ncbi:unnamed protein product [Hydatigera taeniaeformis]|uniref:Uncharacterized protein n=1 Tax=Hydatigena taeniaeformis TaxID=6205 RepID=A0A0R3WXH6_HYDTA|nr:unnamed protein product [Hydatigera taeniaeformis]
MYWLLYITLRSRWLVCAFIGYEWIMTVVSSFVRYEDLNSLAKNGSLGGHISSPTITTFSNLPAQLVVANPAFLETVGKLDVQDTEIEAPMSASQVLRTRRTAIIDLSETIDDKRGNFGTCKENSYAQPVQGQDSDAYNDNETDEESYANCQSPPSLVVCRDGSRSSAYV